MGSSGSSNTSFLNLRFSDFADVDERYEIQRLGIEVYRGLVAAGNSPTEAKAKVEKLYCHGWQQCKMNYDSIPTTRYSTFGDL